MKKFYILFFIHFVTYSFAQKVLNKPITTTTIVTDKNSITMQPGFSFSANSSISFRAYIEGATTNPGNPTTPETNPGNQNAIANENYIRTLECLKEDCSKKKEAVVYFDGLGREKQALQVAASPTGKTIVTPFEYDGFGRQAKEFLPFPIASSDNKISSVTDGSSFYSTLTGDTTPFSEKTFEDSPLNRVLFQAAPGESWKKGADHEVGFSYETNTNGEVLRFDVSLDTNYVPTLVENGNYSAGTLYKTVTTDENKQAIQEFKDKEGKVILKRIDIPKIGELNSSGNHDTYYVYDVYGNLTFVLPPKLIQLKNYKSNLAELGYQYQYDEKNRLVEKQLPGKGREYIVYDKQDRLVGTQDALMEAKNKWLFTKYDKFGRIAITGIQWTPLKRTDLQSYINTLGSNNVSRDSNGYKHDNITIYYTTNGYGATDHVLTVNYYDDYPATASKSTEKNIASGKSLNGLPTHSIVREIDTWNFMYSTTFYDDKYLRPVQTYSTNVLGGYTQINSTLDFRGKVLTTVTKHKRASSDEEITVKETFDYYENELLKTHTHQINNNPVEYLVQNSYNEINQLVNKKVGNDNASTPLQNVDYKYNIRGWMTDINDVDKNNSLFSFKIGYDKTKNSFDKVYNGNISEIIWKTMPDKTIRSYNYSYDGLNRLLDSYYLAKPELEKEIKNAYNENIKGYDHNGNILKITRNGGSDVTNNPLIDELTYDYPNNSNKLVNVSDSRIEDGFKDGNKYSGKVVNDPKNDYAYDANGNLTKDLNKGISQIKYNYLNLPTEVLWNASRKINYSYDASGVKLRKTVTDGSTITTTDYVNGFQYVKKGDSNPVELQFFPTAEGYVNVTDGNKFNYVYNYTDHLGNIRLSYQKDEKGSLTILEENNYYPFGLKHSGYTASTIGNKNYNYKYNGKELQTDLDINLYDYGARNYDPAIGRWFNIDPLAEKYYEDSPFTYASNNPVYFIDLDGMQLGDPQDTNPDKDRFNDFNTMNSFNNEFESKGFYYPPENGTKVGQTYSDEDGDWIWDGDTWVGQDGVEDYVILDNDNIITPNKLEKSDAYFTIPISIPFFEGLGTGALGGLLRFTIGGSFGSMFILTGDKPRDRVVNASDLEKKADDLIPPSVKKSPSYNPKYGGKTRSELDKLAKQGDKIAGKMKKLIDSAKRLSDKNKNK